MLVINSQINQSLLCKLFLLRQIDNAYLEMLHQFNFKLKLNNMYVINLCICPVPMFMKKECMLKNKA